ncbi:MAG: hypothetical protein CI952_622 [Methanohalophilus sp.]|uniref:Uncharacterized protein n=1 Tax=Methanohalophilus euhalobius TaxID=51203 RepID=A0A285GHW1_9EURY|nr:MAG: hypothetical protein CI952_622 [Methanohalophilus sp.]SNY22903.1 hypothetical protein SAMN06295989_1181 [Methanohalophilus euhalobius]
MNEVSMHEYDTGQNSISTKTRIETFDRLFFSTAALSQNSISTKTRIETKIFLLKRCLVLEVKIQYPLKQGLKQKYSS